MSETVIAGRYELGRRLGIGGMSTVQLALDRRLERNVAVKLLAEHLADDPAFVSRFRREALAAARLVHPNVVQVFDFGFDEAAHHHFIVMEHVPGRSCAELLRERGHLDVEEAVEIVAQACRGLDYAHRNGVVHRDVKPGNLLVADDGGRQARRLRDREGDRAVLDHAGRLGARHRRLPRARAGARRGGRSALGPLLARRRRLPAAVRPPALRGSVAVRAGAEAAARAAGAAGRAQPATSRRSSRVPSRSRSRSSRRSARRRPPSWSRRSATARAGSRRPARRAPRPAATTAATRVLASEPTTATRALPRARRPPPQVAARRPRPPAAAGAGAGAAAAHRRRGPPHAPPRACAASPPCSPSRPVRRRSRCRDRRDRQHRQRRADQARRRRRRAAGRSAASGPDRREHEVAPAATRARQAPRRRARQPQPRRACPPRSRRAGPPSAGR